MDENEQAIAPKRRSGALTNQSFIPPLGESNRSSLRGSWSTMVNLITNRHKGQEHGERPTILTKKRSSRRLRRNSLNDAIDEKNTLPHRPKKHAVRKKSGVCPICLARLVKNSKKTRYEHRCEACKSQLKPEMQCTSCGTNRVWSGPSGQRCKGCGNAA